MRVTIVMPVYNARSYLSQTVESVLAQQGVAFELILVDDGSSDTSPGLCNDYAARYDNVRVIHQANAGVSAARNAGLEAARGEYVAFVDSDDEVEPGWLEACCRALDDSGADVLLFGLNKIYTRGGKVSTIQNQLPPFVGGITAGQLPDYMDALCARSGTVCSKMLRVDMLRRHNLRFRPLRVSEDGLFAAEALLAARRIHALGTPYYRYLVREDSAMHRFHEASMEDHFQYAKILSQLIAEDCRFSGRNNELSRRIYAEAFVSLTALMAEKGSGLSAARQVCHIRQVMENSEIRQAVQQVSLKAFGRFPRIKLVLCRHGAYRLAVWLGMARKRLL